MRVSNGFEHHIGGVNEMVRGGTMEKVIIKTCDKCRNVWFPSEEKKHEPCPKCKEKKRKAA